MDELLDEYGAETVSAALEALGHRAERLMRSELEALPNGRWEAEDFLDNDGIEDTPLSIKVALEIQGDQMTLDFTGSAPQGAGPVNLALPQLLQPLMSRSNISFKISCKCGCDAPDRCDCSRRFDFVAEFPAPTGGYTETILRMIDVIFSAFSKAAPDRVVAHAYGTINALSIAGKRKDGKPG